MSSYRTRAGSLAVVMSIVCAGLVTAACDDGSNKYGAIDRCETYIETLLKAPSSADFDNEDGVDNGDGSWDVQGTVDAQNSFGATLRKSWRCTARTDDGGDSWSIDNGYIDE